MQIKIINVPLTDDGVVHSELNKFLAANRVLEVEQQFFRNEKGGCWSFCIRYINLFSVGGGPYQPGGREKVDYKSVLGAKEFAVFSALREIRKQLAAQDAVPAYAVFTDEELSHIAALPQVEESRLTSIKGIGEKKVQKYGKLMVELYRRRLAENPEPATPEPATPQTDIPNDHEALRLFT